MCSGDDPNEGKGEAGEKPKNDAQVEEYVTATKCSLFSAALYNVLYLYSFLIYDVLSMFFLATFKSLFNIVRKYVVEVDH